jgi:predicted SAM-dependent methyltransferase
MRDATRLQRCDTYFELAKTQRRSVIEQLKRMLRVGIDLLNGWIGWLTRNHRVRVPNAAEKLKVNLGCGMSVAPGWLNIDGSLNALVANLPEWTHGLAYRLSGSRKYYTEDYYRSVLRSNQFVHHNLGYGVPLVDKTADFVFCSHFLEHLDPKVAENLLRECRRVLRAGGVVRIVVPDLRYAWKMYERGEKQHMLHDFFFVGDDASFSRHRYAYDYEMLADLLRSVGFDEVCHRQYQQGWTPDLGILDNRAEYSLFVEARA